MAVKVDLLLNDGSFSSKIKQAAQGFVQMANAIKGAKNAQMAFNNVLKANPFGLVTYAATEAAQALYKYVMGVYDAQDAEAKLNIVIAETKAQLDSIDNNLDFDTKIAQACGASWEALHQLKLEAAKTAESLAFETMAQAPYGSDQRREAEALWNKARERLNKVNTEGTVNTLQRIYQTGPYKPKNGRGGGGGDTQRELTEEQRNQQRINELVQEYVNLRNKEATADNVERLAQLQKEINLLERRNQQLAFYKENAYGRMLGGTFDLPQVQTGISFASWKPQAITPEIKEQIKNMKVPEQESKEERAIVNMSNQFSQFSGGISSIAGGLEQLGIELPDGLKQMISILMGISSILTGIAAISIIPFFSRGGVVHAASGFVPGKYGYDAVPAMLTSGEMVLNRAQQGNLASQLQGGGIGNLQLSATVSGEQIRLALNNNGRRTGRGEYVTTNFR